jgi:hypothetical protein
VIASCYVSYRTSYDTRTDAVRDFRELRQRELRRIPLPRTPVNKGKKEKKGRDIVAQILASSK